MNRASLFNDSERQQARIEFLQDQVTVLVSENLRMAEELERAESWAVGGWALAVLLFLFYMWG